MIKYRLANYSNNSWAAKANIESYAQRQAQSCLYLKKLFNSILKTKVAALFPDLPKLFNYLVKVHLRQYKDLKGVVDVPVSTDRQSFYFSEMYDRADNLVPSKISILLTRHQLLKILIIQFISYLRGHDRYKVLKHYNHSTNKALRPVWRKFYRDALSNANHVLEFIQNNFDAEQIKQEILKLIKAEGSVMQKIWSQQGLVPTIKKSAPTLHAIISSGGTTVPIDDVRYITNFAKGKTGALIAEEGLKRGHKINYIYALGATKPFLQELTINPDNNLEQELARLSQAVRIYHQLSPRLINIPVRDFEAYYQTILKEVKRPSSQVTILAMAASDYGPTKLAGKIDSQKNTFTIKLHKLPKIILQIKKTKKNIFLVGFKLLTRLPSDELIERTYQALLKSKQDLAVANRLNPPGQEPTTYLITVERNIIPVYRRDNLSRRLWEEIENRYSGDHYHTILKNTTRPLTSAKIVNDFIKEVKLLSKLSLFEPYFKDSRQEFGFVAKRMNSGFLITSRGSSKSRVNRQDIVWVKRVNHQTKTVEVVSQKNKASLNVNVADMIFRQRLDINYIIHAHINLPLAPQVEHSTAPGTYQDAQQIKNVLKNGVDVIGQPYHGSFVLLKNLSDVFSILEKNNVYNAQAEMYDLAYARFQRNHNFTDLVVKNLKRSDKILDLCAGTGDVAQQLLHQGFKNLFMADASPEMLLIAQHKTKLPKNRILHLDMSSLSAKEQFNGIIVRQAVNYIPPNRLSSVLNKIRMALKNNGRLIFNSFIYNSKSQTERTSRLVIDNQIVITHENNLVQKNVLHHSQITSIFDENSGGHRKVYDLNSFYIYSQQDFIKALRMAGFSKIKVSHEKQALYFICQK